MNTGNSSDEPNSTDAAVGHTRVAIYEIRVRGHLGQHLASWFDGLELCDRLDGTTSIRGPVTDQAALHGLLHRLRDLGIPLVSLTELRAEAPVPSPSPPPASGVYHPSGSTTTPGATP